MKKAQAKTFELLQGALQPAGAVCTQGFVQEDEQSIVQQRN